MKKQYLVVNADDSFDYYIVDELESLIREMYECELETNSLEQINEWFNQNHKVFKVEGTVEEIN